MKVLRTLIWFAALLLPVAASAQLSQQAVQKLIADLDQAAAQRDAAGVARLLSDNVEIVITVRSSGQSQKQTFNKQTYIDMLTKVWAGATAYEFTRSNMKITLSGPSRAVVSALVKEKMTVKNEEIFTTSNQSAVIEVIGGRPLITRIAASSTM